MKVRDLRAGCVYDFGGGDLREVLFLEGKYVHWSHPGEAKVYSILTSGFVAQAIGEYVESVQANQADPIPEVPAIIPVPRKPKTQRADPNPIAATPYPSPDRERNPIMGLEGNEKLLTFAHAWTWLKDELGIIHKKNPLYDWYYYGRRGARLEVVDGGRLYTTREAILRFLGRATHLRDARPAVLPAMSSEYEEAMNRLKERAAIPNGRPAK